MKSNNQQSEPPPAPRPTDVARPACRRATAWIAALLIVSVGCQSDPPADPGPTQPVDPTSTPTNPVDPTSPDPTSPAPTSPDPTSKDPAAAKPDQPNGVAATAPVSPVAPPAALPDSPAAAPLTRKMLDEALALGREHLITNQQPLGNFRYHYNFLTGEDVGEDSQVRQAGALWGLALIHLDHPTPETQAAVLKGLDYFRQCSDTVKDRGTYIEYPGDFRGMTGTVSLVSLAWIELIRSAPDDPQAKLWKQQLDGYLSYLVSLRKADGRFRGEYRFGSGLAIGQPSPYYDGETLLALVKASRYLGRDDLRPLVLESAERMYQLYVVEARKQEPDSEQTKAFFQWGSMAFFELHQAGWPGTEPYAARTIDLSHWMIDTHHVLNRRRNTAYAYEGLVCGWELARVTGDAQSQAKIGDAIDQGLSRLCTWQVGSSVQNAYLRDHPPQVDEAKGGVLGAADEPWLRVDVTQHQMHAVILARRYFR